MGDANRSDLIKRRTEEGERTLPGIKSKAQKDSEEDIFERDPKKMYVRVVAWLEIIRNFVNKKKADGAGNEIKYFTLPGRRGIDIGVLWKADLLKRENGHWKNVAICDNRYANEVVSLLGTFAATSHRSLQDVLNKPAESLVKFFPVDVINLDFCNAVLENEATQISQTNLNIIENLFRLQRGRGFLLLLTHKVGNEEYGGQVKQLLVNTIQLNLQENNAFRASFIETYHTENVNAFVKDLPRFGLLATAKYVARLAKTYGYKVMEQFTGYYVRGRQGIDEYYMGVNSFEFEPLGRKPEKRYVPRFPVNNPALIDLSESLVKQAEQAYSEYVASLPGRPVINVHSLLEANATLKRQYTDKGIAFMDWSNELKD